VLRPRPARVGGGAGRRGKLLVGEPYFTPGVPLVLDSKSAGAAGPGDLAVVRPGRGRARIEAVLGRANRIEDVLEALLVERGARQPFEQHGFRSIDTANRVDLRDVLTYTIDPATAKGFDEPRPL